MGRKSREKGKRAERQAAAWFAKNGWQASRGAQHRGSEDSPDIVIPDLPGLHVEVKIGKRMPNIPDAMRQAERDAGAAKLPVVMCRRDRDRWHFVLNEESFAGLLQLLHTIERIPQ